LLISSVSVLEVLESDESFVGTSNNDDFVVGSSAAVA
jgi:hypothetical protein